NFFALGASYRSLSSVNLFGEIKISSRFSLGYAYEYTTTDLQKFNSGTHEIMLRFDVGNSKSKVVTPRYF
ncbi:MAG: type IX secretion system membrane protein PorP/SprF, partial [Bacteroidota bacterium]|nr:type IX secretion system membrane protein PorP/SprF [Bacteroidota bacterium]MDP4275699.1 type IX secretion system membrane protein PorP/SprF [Bacteroidota bacterium]